MCELRSHDLPADSGRACLLNWCIVCGKLYCRPRAARTCFEACHKKFIDALVKQFGEFKQVADPRTGKATP